LHGSNRNILVSPISSYFSVYKRYSYQDRYERQPQPKTVKVNGIEPCDWEWSNKAGKVDYQMTGREITLDIKFGGEGR